MNIKYTILFLFIYLSIAGYSQKTAWFTNSVDAKEYATKNQVPIMLVFAGSDWCKPCMMLKHDILESEMFQTYFPSQFALLYLDFPMHKKNKLAPNQMKQNEMLAEKYNKSGLFPNLIIIETNGKIVGQLNFKQQTTEVFIEQCNALLKKQVQ